MSKPPSTKIRKFFKAFEGPRDLQSRVVQVLLGHCFVGEYAERFNVGAGDTGCECGAPHETLEHVLLECFKYSRAREALYERFLFPTRKKIFGSEEGLEALADFLHRCKAFRKRSRPRGPDAADDGDGG